MKIKILLYCRKRLSYTLSTFLSFFLVLSSSTLASQRYDEILLNIPRGIGPLSSMLEAYDEAAIGNDKDLLVLQKTVAALHQTQTQGGLFTAVQKRAFNDIKAIKASQAVNSTYRWPI